MNLKKIRKKGTIEDIFGVMAGIFVLAMVVIFLFVFISRTDAEVQQLDIFPQDSKDASTKIKGLFPGIIDEGLVFVFFMALIAVLILASLVIVHPAFIIPFIMIWLFSIWTGAILADTYDELANSAQLIEFTSQLTFTSWLFTYLPFIVGVFGAILAIVMFKRRGVG